MANKEKIKLTRAEKRQLQALMRSRQQRKKAPHSVQETIPYERMWPDGICRVSPSYYTKTVQFWDINYQLAQNEDKSAIFEGLCDFLNAFCSSVHLPLPDWPTIQQNSPFSIDKSTLFSATTRSLPTA